MSNKPYILISELPEKYRNFEYKQYDRLEIDIDGYKGVIFNDNLEYTVFELYDKDGKKTPCCCTMDKIEYDEKILEEATKFYIRVYEEIKKQSIF